MEEERETEGRKRKELSRTGKEREREGAERLGKRERRGEGPALKSWKPRARRGRGRKARVRKGKGKEARDASGKRRERRGEGGLNSNENKIHFGDQTYNCTGYPRVPLPVPGYCYFLVWYLENRWQTV